MDINNIIITSVVAFVVFSVNNNYMPSRLKAKISTKEQTYYIDAKDLIFIGESRNYLFLYDKPKSGSLVLKRDDIKDVKYYSLQ